MLKSIISKNVIAKSLGMGYHGTHVPSVMCCNLPENPGWYTAHAHVWQKSPRVV